MLDVKEKPPSRLTSDQRERSGTKRKIKEVINEKTPPKRIE